MNVVSKTRRFPRRTTLPLTPRETFSALTKTVFPSAPAGEPVREKKGSKERLYRTDVVIISDIHLGSDVCRARQLRAALKEWYPFRRLIILGDLFDDLNFSRLTKHHFKLIDDLRKLTNPKRGVTVDWIEGNHDVEGAEIIRRMIGANVHSELLLELRSEKYLFIHGHQFDEFLRDYPRISNIACNVYDAVQRREGEAKSVSRWLKRKSKGWVRICERIEDLATDYARQRGADYVVCGHTHYFNPGSGKNRDIQYINTGCWTDTPCTLVTIGPEGLRRHLYE